VAVRARGTGIVWGRADAWGAVDATIPAFEPQSFGEWSQDLPPAPMDGVRFTPGGYHSFEHRWALFEAFRFHLDIGKDRVAARTHEQATRLKEGLADLPGITVVTPAGEDMSSGIVCFDVAGTPPPDVLGRLDSAGIVASITPYRQAYVRPGAQHRHHARRGRRRLGRAGGLTAARCRPRPGAYAAMGRRSPPARLLIQHDHPGDDADPAWSPDGTRGWPSFGPGRTGLPPHGRRCRWVRCSMSPRVARGAWGTELVP
jgi:Aminotransferase class-V